jgi:hypothetical protein
MRPRRSCRKRPPRRRCAGRGCGRGHLPHPQGPRHGPHLPGGRHLHAPAEQVAARLGDIPYELEPIDERTCRLHRHADTLEWLASRLIMLGCEIPDPRAAGARQVLARARRPGHPRGRRSSIGRVEHNRPGRSFPEGQPASDHLAGSASCWPDAGHGLPDRVLEGGGRTSSLASATLAWSGGRPKGDGWSGRPGGSAG